MSIVYKGIHFFFFLLIFLKLFQVQSEIYNETLSLIAYNLSASAYADDNEEAIIQCFEKSYPNYKFSNLHHSTFQCDDSNGDTCGGVYANFPDINTTIIAFRGTKQSLELIKETIQSLENFIPYNFSKNGVISNLGYVNKYYLKASEIVYEKFILGSANEESLYKNIILTGHSLGGALATLLALKLTLTGISKDRINVITFGEPRIGDHNLASLIHNNVPNLYRVVHYQDIVPHFPPCSSNNNNGCFSKDKKPYHHPQEIWYNKNLKMTKGVYVVCNPNNGEDNNCSDKYFSAVQSFFNGGWESEHMNYFGTNIHSYGVQGCNSSIKIKLSHFETSFIFIILFFYYNFYYS